ncbi:Fic family protein [Pontiellaceae bacterium B1224]|nr:Fic family protein [Pontiellaceae bacterium B1224]
MNVETPPFTISAKAVSLIAEICEMLGRVSAETGEQKLRLRRINRIRTIQGSLAIEGNTLNEEQISAILEGKPVMAPPQEVQEVRNALQVYETMHIWMPSKKSDLLAAHALLMKGLLDAPGNFRSKGAGVMGKQGIVHYAPPADRVPYLVQNLLDWLAHTDAHPLIAASVFHYEFEFIHPFEDGNGRMGRLWQALILSRWKPIFANLPVESLVHTHQPEYYAALNQSSEQADCAPFIDFMLETIRETLAASAEQDTSRPELRLESRLESKLAARIVLLLQKESLGKAAMAAALGHKTVSGELNKQVRRLAESGYIEMTRPEKPNSRLQQYRLTAEGRALLEIRTANVYE